MKLSEKKTLKRNPSSEMATNLRNSGQPLLNEGQKNGMTLADAFRKKSSVADQELTTKQGVPQKAAHSQSSKAQGRTTNSTVEVIDDQKNLIEKLKKEQEEIAQSFQRSKTEKLELRKKMMSYNPRESSKKSKASSSDKTQLQPVLKNPEKTKDSSTLKLSKKQSEKIEIPNLEAGLTGGNSNPPDINRSRSNSNKVNSLLYRHFANFLRSQRKNKKKSTNGCTVNFQKYSRSKRRSKRSKTACRGKKI
jgi:hypothetical protein